jgi:pimeloyl-ACP methyl ester carboxylesterase
MTRFVLVHGAWHHGGCWDRLVDELARRGHTGIAVDLPSDRPGLGALDYAEVVARAVEAQPCVLVGHSLGGLTVPVAAQGSAAAWVEALVLVAALVPQPGRSLDDQIRSGASPMARGFGRGQQRHDDRTTSWPIDAARNGLYAGVAEEVSAGVVDAAVAGLHRQAWEISREISPLASWPAVPTTIVVCRGDRVVDPDGLAARARSLPGARVVDLPGGHFPMLTRPEELADVLIAADGTRLTST